MREDSTKKRSQAADCAKGLAAVLVIAGHLIERDSVSLPEPYLFFEILQAAHMPLFFLLSGWFAVKLLEQPFPAALKKACVRLMVPYFVWSGVAVAAKTAVSIARGQFDTLESLRLLGTTLLLGTSLWFFLALFLTQMLAWAVYRLERRRGLPGWLLPLLLVMLLPLPMEQSNYALYRLHDLLPVFYLGFYARRRWDGRKAEDGLPLRGLAAAGFALLLVSPWLSSLQFNLPGGVWNPVRVAAELPVIAGVFVPGCLLIGRNRCSEQLFAELGRYSMDIYCIHMVFVEYICFRIPSSLMELPQAVSASAYFLEAVLIAVLCMWITKALRRFFRPYDWLMSGKWPFFNHLEGFNRVKLEQ